MTRYALCSVTHKDGLVDFARGLVNLGFTILSTGGSFRVLQEYGVPVREVASFTESPEILGGRVKTLHPKIHGGILLDRSNPEHLADAAKLKIEPIDLVVVNLYDFAKQAIGKDLGYDEAIEFIDVGGPTMLRAAAKNHRFCAPVIDPSDYPMVLAELRRGDLSVTTRRQLALKVFTATAQYDGMIAAHLAGLENKEEGLESKTELLPASINLNLRKVKTLRYGENPHQQAALYGVSTEDNGLLGSPVLQGKELSYNNFLDLDAAAGLARDLYPTPVVVIVKHTNPCGVATGSSSREAFERALAADPKSAFGGIVASNLPIDAAAAKVMASIFLECIIAPEFSAEAIAILAAKKNLRLVVGAYLQRRPQEAALVYRSVAGGLLAQSEDTVIEDPATWRCVTKVRPSPAELKDLSLAMVVVKHVKSNGIVYVRDGATLAVGAGQMSRIDAAQFAVVKAKELGFDLKGCVVASDAFFPFRDTIDFLAGVGVKAVVQPGGSLRDEESIQAADEHGLSMVLTGVRHFRH